MYKGFQEKMFQNPWGVNEGFKHLQEKLDELLPMMGRCEFPNSKNKALDKFRRAQNAAYDLFNNGLINRRGQFNNIFGFAPTLNNVHYSNKDTWTHWENMVEEVMTPIIQAAAKEQGVQ